MNEHFQCINVIQPGCVSEGVSIKAHCSSEVRITTILNSGKKDAPLLEKHTSRLLYNGNCGLDKSKRNVSILSMKGMVITVERGNYCI